MTDSFAPNEDLCRRIEHGDEKALAVLFERHRERLWRIVNFRLDHRLQGRVDPDDVLQESFLAAAQRIGHFKSFESRSPFLWLRLIVNQTLIEAHRQHLGARMRDAGREIAIEGYAYPQATSVSLAIHLIGSMTSPSRVAMRGELLERVEKAIDAMETIDQEVLALRHFEELTNSEVAEVLKIQPKAASIRYIRAVQRLKTILSSVPGFFEVDDNA
jgi:RNA polymerase sigma-70 factor (ECF subfamily)